MARQEDAKPILNPWQRTHMVGALLLTAAISVIDYHSGNRIPFLMVYFLPVVWLNWTVGWKAAMSVACLNVFIWSFVSLASSSRSAPSWPPLWNGFRGFVYLGVSYLFTMQRRLSDLEKRWAYEDALTGLANRRAFFHWSRKVLIRAQRYATPVTVAMLDVDNFKIINDRWGHAQGDKVLVWLADTIRSNLRATDFLARLGGDEFAVLLADSTIDDAQATIANIHEILKISARELGLAVSVTVGVAAFRPAPLTVDEMLLAADRNMYRVKKIGKNRLGFQSLSARA